MKVVYLLFWGLVGALTLAACSPNTSALTSAPDPESKVVGDEGGLYPAQDLALVANTRRPQFIHSYADW